MNAKQHIQGFINHGRGITLFRTFNNIYNGTNLAVHTWLLGLEETYLSEGGKLPDTIYSQIDGGSENCQRNNERDLRTSCCKATDTESCSDQATSGTHPRGHRLCFW